MGALGERNKMIKGLYLGKSIFRKKGQRGKKRVSGFQWGKRGGNEDGKLRLILANNAHDGS